MVCLLVEAGSSAWSRNDERGAGHPTCRGENWTFEPYLQHQLCFTSMTGQFSCTVSEVTVLPETSSGETPDAPQPVDGAGPKASAPSETVRVALTDLLRSRGPALFADERRLKIEPLLKAAGVAVRATAPTVRR